MLVLLIACGFASRCQKTLSSEEWRTALLLMQEGQDAKDSLKVYTALNDRKDSLIAGLQKEIVRKEGVIVRLIDQRNTLSNERKNIDEQMKSKDMLIDSQRETIAKLNKPVRRWGLGVLGGFGATSTGGIVRTGITMAAGVYYRIL